MNKFMKEALKEAELGLKEGGIPIGAVVVYDDKIVGRGHNRRIQKGSVILHAEMDALENLGRKSASFYKKCVLYTTLSPCPMCSGAIILYGISEVVIGENKNFKGEEELLESKGVKVTILEDKQCVDIMDKFIKNNPKLWNEDIGV